MQREIIKIKPDFYALPVIKKVAAYVRVSSRKDAMLHSLSAQISYYSAFIQKSPQWALSQLTAFSPCFVPASTFV